MELRHLRYFTMVARTLNFSRAAEQLHVVQPALSRQIRDLEEELGTVLLDRNRTHVRLTDSGRLFLAHCEKILAQVDIAVRSVKDSAGGIEGTLVVCTDWRLPVNLIPDTVTAFRRRFPRVEVDLRELPMLDHVSALRTRRAHLGFVPEEAIPVGAPLSRLVVLRAQIVVVVPGSHSLAGSPQVKLSDLRHETWLCAETEDNGHRHFVTQCCRMSGFTPLFGRPGGSIEAVMGRVSAGYGVALVPSVVAIPSQLRLISLATDCEPVAICAVWHREEKSLLLHNFLDTLRGLVDRSPAPAETRGAAARPLRGT